MGMRRFLVSLSRFVAPSALLLLSTTPASAQDATPPPPALAPPPPLDPNVPGSQPGDPNAPGQPGQTTTPEQATAAKLDEAERDDNGRKFELVWIDAHLGGSYIDMRQFSSSSFQIEKASSAGPMVSLGAGLRLLVLVLGVRAKYNALSAFNMWQVNGELGFKIPIGQVDILIGGHGGYSFVGSLGDGTVAASTAGTPTNTDAVKIRGFNAGLDFAVDYYLTDTFSIGGGFFADFLFLNRPPVDKPAGLPPQAAAALDNEPLYKQSGTSAGLQLGGALRLGVHFGL
jgi:hypothetical protein